MLSFLFGVNLKINWRNVNNANDKHHKCSASQLNFDYFLIAPVFTFHGANLPERTLSEDEAPKKIVMQQFSSRSFLRQNESILRELASIRKNMTDAPKTKSFRFVLTLLAIALALLGAEAIYYFSTPQLDDEQKMLLAWQGVQAPDFSVTNIDGQPIHLADLKGKRVILNFWATWCVPCQIELPSYIKLAAETSPTNVVIFGLSPEDVATQKNFAQHAGINYPLTVLQNIPSPYQDVQEIPMTLVIDRHGVIQQVAFGPQDLKALEAFANEADYSGTVKTAPIAPK